MKLSCGRRQEIKHQERRSQHHILSKCNHTTDTETMTSKPDIVKEGWLKRVKNKKERYFVLCFNKDTGAAQLEYYESQRKFNSNSEPKRTIFLQDCLGIINKKDSKYGQLLVLYTKEDVFALTADSEELLESWFSNLDKLHKMENKNLQESKYDLVWNVKVIPRGLGGVKNMTGSYKLCLKDDSLYFVNPASQEILNEEKLYHVRRYGHQDYCFFMEFGRSTTLGAGEIWMEVEDPLIAQKIHETLSRSVKPPTGESAAVSKKSKSTRHSMVVHSKGDIVDPLANNNNNSSPKSRRSTLLPNFITKKRDTSRPHSRSVSSGTPNVTTEEDMITDRFRSFTPSTKDDEDSEEEGVHYPHITPPVPSVNPRRSTSSSSGSLESIHSRSDRKGRTASMTKSLNEGNSGTRTLENDYSLMKPSGKRRSVKQDCSAVRMGYAAEQRRSASLPRRPSASSTERARTGSDCEKNGESDKDGAHYLNMKPRQRIASDSSSDGPPPTLPSRQKPGASDVYIKMSSPGHTPNLERSRLSTSLPSSDSNNSTEELVLDHEGSTYVNMALGSRRQPRMGSSSNESADETSETTEETFDHLNHGSQTSEENTISQGECYVTMGPRNPTASGGLKKCQSQINRSSRSDYVNVNVSRSQSVGSKTPRPKPLFEIVPEQGLSGSNDEESGRHSPCSYVNVQTKNSASLSSESKQQYANFVPIMKPNGSAPARNSPALNYTSVDFSEKRHSSTNELHRTHPPGRNSPSNYSTIDFQKSKGLADISNLRERQHHRVNP